MRWVWNTPNKMMTLHINIHILHSLQHIFIVFQCVLLLLAKTSETISAGVQLKQDNLRAAVHNNRPCAANISVIKFRCYVYNILWMQGIMKLHQLVAFLLAWGRGAGWLRMHKHIGCCTLSAEIETSGLPTGSIVPVQLPMWWMGVPSALILLFLSKFVVVFNRDAGISLLYALR